MCVLQDGQFVALQTLDLKRPSNTSAQGSVYTVFPQSDNANQFGLFNTTCSAQTSNMNQYDADPHQSVRQQQLQQRIPTVLLLLQV